jgi:ribosomal protein S6--L-glutamate ligase
MTTLAPLLLGWKEWASLPSLNIPLIKVKIDTGAKTSALHAYDLKIIQNDGKKYAHFVIHPLQKNTIISRKAIAEVIDIRVIRSSNGQKEERPVINSTIRIGDYAWEIEITLTKRDIMHHRMLLGREAMSVMLIDPAKTYCQGRTSLKNARLKYLD